MKNTTSACACGARATRKYNGTICCEACRVIEAKAGELKRAKTGVKEQTGQLGNPKNWERNWMEVDARPIVGGSLAVLEQMLQRCVPR